MTVGSVLRWIGCWAALLCIVTPLVAPAQVQTDGLFSADETVRVPRPGQGLERATLRSRGVRVDLRQISAARRQRGPLKLNLFDDAVFEARVERVRPTRSGHFLSGRIVGQPAGEMALVVSGSVVVGTVRTPQETYTIRSLGSGRHVVRQIDPSALPPGAPPVESPPPEYSGA